MEGTSVAIRSIRSVGPSTVAVEVETPSGFEARPGQFLQVRATVDGESVTRHYSISSPYPGETVEVTVGVDPKGTLSPHLAEAEPGTTVDVAGPFGRVYYEGESAVTVYCSGPGIGPGLAVAERTVAEGGVATLLYRSDAPVHEARLASLAAAGASVYLLGEETDFERAVASTTGSGEAADDGDPQAFVYGFAGFVETAESTIAAVGIDPTDAKVENFG